MRTWTTREATLDDVEGWTSCHRACWRETYPSIADPAVLTARLADVEGWRERIRRMLASDGPPRWLALSPDGEPVGLACGGPSRPDVAEHAAYEQYALYVRAAWHGTGLGQELLDRAIGDRSACLEVMEENARARAFYARNGFEVTAHRSVCESLGAWQVVMVRGR